jgi:hypothetical protein
LLIDSVLYPLPIQPVDAVRYFHVHWFAIASALGADGLKVIVDTNGAVRSELMQFPSLD